jgi:hypothetical protein
MSAEKVEHSGKKAETLAKKPRQLTKHKTMKNSCLAIYFIYKQIKKQFYGLFTNKGS